jgi:hypothetical protein
MLAAPAAQNPGLDAEITRDLADRQPLFGHQPNRFRLELLREKPPLPHSSPPPASARAS